MFNFLLGTRRTLTFCLNFHQQKRLTASIITINDNICKIAWCTPRNLKLNLNAVCRVLPLYNKISYGEAPDPFLWIGPAIRFFLTKLVGYSVFIYDNETALYALADIRHRKDGFHIKDNWHVALSE